MSISFGKKIAMSGRNFAILFLSCLIYFFFNLCSIVLKTNKKHDSSPIFFEPNINDNMGKQILGYTYVSTSTPSIAVAKSKCKQVCLNWQHFSRMIDRYTRAIFESLLPRGVIPITAHEWKIDAPYFDHIISQHVPWTLGQ